VDGRARIAFSGLAAFAVTATVVATVVTTNAAAFADAPGTAIDAAVVDVKASAEPATAVPSEIVTDLTDAAPPAPAATPSPDPSQAETLPAPAPVVVVATAPPAASPEPVESPDSAVSLRDALASDDPEAIYAWAAAHGWSRERVDRFLATRPGPRESDEHDRGMRHDERGERRDGGDHPRFDSPDSPVQTGSPAVTESPQRGDGSKRDRSPGSPDHRD
jgi:hypothetical protein